MTEHGRECYQFCDVEVNGERYCGQMCDRVGMHERHLCRDHAYKRRAELYERARRAGPRD